MRFSMANPKEREQMLARWAEVGKPQYVGVAVKALKDPNVGVRRAAAVALQMMRDERVVEPLSEALKDKEPSVREQAAIALGKTGDPEATKALAPVLKDRNVDVRRAAAASLKLLNWRPATAE